LAEMEITSFVVICTDYLCRNG